MNELDNWLMNSEAASRFYRAVIDIEDALHGLYWWFANYKIRARKKNILHDYYELPPIVHNSAVWGQK